MHLATFVSKQWTIWAFFFLCLRPYGCGICGGELHERLKREVRCTPKYRRIPNHSMCLEKSSKVEKSSFPSKSDQADIIKYHNGYRSNTRASDMLKMVWDSDVALVAQRWAENCKTEHDGYFQRMIPGRFNVGQNIATKQGSMSWQEVVSLWYDEVNYFQYNISAKKSGHYTQVVWAESTVVGCGYAVCDGQHYYVCNYAPGGNVIARKKIPYTAGKKCGKCEKHCSGSLCDCSGKVCLNGGTLDLATCTCSCRPSYEKINNCAMNCSTVVDSIHCGEYYKKAMCEQIPSVVFDCPHLCGLCGDHSGKMITRGSYLIPLLAVLLSYHYLQTL